MRTHLATVLDEFRRYNRDFAVIRMQGNRRRETTYAELARLAGRFSALLAARGIGQGDRVVLWAENSAEWVAAFYGIILRGALAVPLDAYGSPEFTARVTEDVRPKLVVGDLALLGRLRSALSQVSTSRPGAPRVGDRDSGIGDQGSEIPMLAFEGWGESLPEHEAGPVADLGPDTPLQILFTSGTTGEPKGIVHTHGNVLASVGPIEKGARPYMRYERIFHPLRFLHTLPLSHVFGQTMGLWVPAIFGAEVHFESRLVAPRLMETIQRERISVLAAVPRVMALLKSHLELMHPGLAERVALARGVSPWLRWWRFGDVHWALGLKFWALISGGGALPGQLEQFWNGLGFVVVQGYGMTETTALITLNHPFHVASGTIGKPLPGREVKLGPDGEVLVRGAMISDATWSGGQLQRSADAWLATGDLAEETATGELRFLGRKSEVIVTATGVNIHPEDLEEAIEQEPDVKGCAVVSVETANGPEPYAVLAVRGGAAQAQAAVEHANERLAEFQRVRRWSVWPEPDLPRTSTGKVRRKTVAAWVAGAKAKTNGKVRSNGTNPLTHGDWLIALIASTTGEAPTGSGDELLLSEDLHLDSLGRAQLAAALEERLGDAPAERALDEVRTLGELRRLVGGENDDRQESGVSDRKNRSQGLGNWDQEFTTGIVGATRQNVAAGTPRGKYVYPRWPWWAPVAWVRTAFLELIAQPLVWVLAKPRVTGEPAIDCAEPMLVICNHVTAFDGPLVEYALPGRMRRRMAVAMSGEMLEDFRHFRDPERMPGQNRFMFWGPLAYFLLTALYNVFPLPRQKDFQTSFGHAGEALDRGYNVMVFPEGTRSAAGALARFRPGIGLLVKQSQTAIQPVAIRGLGELKLRGSGWFRSGRIEVCVGEPLRFSADQTEAEITARLHAEVEKLLCGGGSATRAIGGKAVVGQRRARPT
jgi:long-chain acyl-CoA synthetase